MPAQLNITWSGWRQEYHCVDIGYATLRIQLYNSLLEDFFDNRYLMDVIKPDLSNNLPVSGAILRRVGKIHQKGISGHACSPTEKPCSILEYEINTHGILYPAYEAGG
jgi:hypothetical protein